MEIKETHMVEGTPFTVLKTDDEKMIIAMGTQIMTEVEFNTYEEATDYIKEKPWDLLASVVLVLCNHLIQTKEAANVQETEG